MCNMDFNLPDRTIDHTYKIFTSVNIYIKRMNQRRTNWVNDKIIFSEKFYSNYQKFSIKLLFIP